MASPKKKPFVDTNGTGPFSLLSLSLYLAVSLAIFRFQLYPSIDGSGFVANTWRGPPCQEAAPDLPGWSGSRGEQPTGAPLDDVNLRLSRPIMRGPKILEIEQVLQIIHMPAACFAGKPCMEGMRQEVCEPLYCVRSSTSPSTLVDVFISPYSLLNASSVTAATCAEPSGALLGSAAKRDAPQVSFIITFKNRVTMTLQSLLELLRTCWEADSVEFIVVDDGSDEDTSDIAAAGRLIQRLFGIRFLLLHNRGSQGYGGANMVGVREARGHYALLLNNDVFPLQGWLHALLATATARPSAGIIGPMFVSANGTVMEAGALVFSNGAAANFGRGWSPSHDLMYARPVDYISAASILLVRQTFLEIGGFDAIYGPGYWEDTDLAFAYAAKGLEVLYQPASVVVHEGGGTLSSAKTMLMSQNRAIFKAKWAAALRERTCPGTTPLPVAAMAHAPARLLWLDDIVPEPDRDSGSIRTHNLLRILQRMGYQVSFQALTDGRDARYTAAARAAGVRVLSVAPTEQWQMSFDGSHCLYDGIIAARYYIYNQTREVLARVCPGTPLIFDTVDVHFLRVARGALSEGNQWDFSATAPSAVLEWLETSTSSEADNARAMRDAELALMDAADVTLVVCERERDLLQRYRPDAKIVVVSNVHDTHEPAAGAAAAQQAVQRQQQQQQQQQRVRPPGGRRWQPDAPRAGAVGEMVAQPDAVDGLPRGRRCAERAGILFVGNFNHLPNQQAVMTLITDVVPMLREAMPADLRDTMVLHLVGSNKVVQTDLAELAKMPVIFHGWLSDEQLQLLYGSVRVVVAPLLSGAGVKGKVNQAMLMGVPVVVTPVAAEGMHLVDGEDALVARTPEEFAAKVVEVCSDCKLWDQLVEGGRRNLRRWFSMDVAAEALRAALDAAGVPPPQNFSLPRCS